MAHFVGYKAQFSVEISGNLTLQRAENAGLLAQTSDGSRDPAGPQLAAALGKTHALHNCVNRSEWDRAWRDKWAMALWHDRWSRQCQQQTMGGSHIQRQKWSTGVAQRQPAHDRCVL